MYDHHSERVRSAGVELVQQQMPLNIEKEVLKNLGM